MVARSYYELELCSTNIISKGKKMTKQQQQQQQQQGYNIYYHITMKGGNHPYEYFPTSQTPFQNMPSWGGAFIFYHHQSSYY